MNSRRVSMLRSVGRRGPSPGGKCRTGPADTEIGSNARLNLGDSFVALGRLAEAKTHFQAVERIVRNPRPQDRWMLWRYAQHLFHSLGELWLTSGDTVAALACAEDCLHGA